MSTTILVVCLVLIPVMLILVSILVIALRVYNWYRRVFKGEESKQQSHKRREGKVTVVRTEPTEQRVNDDVGEYVDFKEIKERK